MSGFRLADERWIGSDHCFAVWDVDVDALADTLADAVRDHYADPAALHSSLTSAMEGLDGVADLVAIQQIVDNVVTAVVPVQQQRQTSPWLELTRNEVGEVLAHYAAEEYYGASVVSRLRHKEIPELPTRGMDLLGLGEDAGQAYLLAGEVKSSDSAASPPAVVGEGQSSLRSQLKNLTANKQRILRELSWSHKHAMEDQRPRIASALILYARDKLPVRVFPVLVRPRERHRDSDFGCFESEHSTFLPEHIRFCLLRLPCSLEHFASLVYGKARNDAGG